VLGATFYETCTYGKVNVNTDKVVQTYKPTHFIQQATLEYLGADNWSEGDAAYIFTTSKAREDNWRKDITERSHWVKGASKTDPYVGLEKLLEEMKLPFRIEAVDIPNGNGEFEMWKIFNAIFSKIKEGDELYFDLTHSFRYIPMLVLVLGNYSKFLKNVKISSITYGNFEAARGREDGVAPIVDLMPLTVLQDWTFAAADLIRNGNSDRLRELSNSSYLTQMLRLKEPGKKLNMNERAAEETIQNYIKALHEMLLNLRLCRLPQILSGETIKEVEYHLKAAQNQLKTDNESEDQKNVISIIPPILEKIRGTFEGFSTGEDIHKGYLAAQWCCEHQLYQQAITILHENITTAMCRQLKIKDRIYANRHLAAYYLREEKMMDDDLKKIEKADADNIRKNRNAARHFITHFKDVAKWMHSKRNTYDHAAMSLAEEKTKTGLSYVEKKLTSQDIVILRDLIIPYVLNPTDEEKRNEICKLVQSSL